MDNKMKMIMDNTWGRITTVRVVVYVPGGVSLPDRVRVALKEQDKFFFPFRRKLATVSLQKATWTPVTHDVLRAESRQTVDISVDELLRLSQRKHLALQLSCRRRSLVHFKSLAGFSLLLHQTKDEELFLQIHYPGCCPQDLNKAVQEDEGTDDSFLSTTSQQQDTLLDHSNNTDTTHSTQCHVTQDSSEEATHPFFFPLPRLSQDDRQDILQKRWLSDDVMDLAQEIVRRLRPQTRGLYACAGAFTLDPLDPADDTLFLQIINASTPSSISSLDDYLRSAGSHWLLATNFGAERGSLCLYDSLNTSATSSTTQLMRHLLSRSTTFRISFPRVQQQRDSYSCGMYAIAFAFSIAVGEDPASLIYHHDRMASHLLECLEQGCLKPFPSRSVAAQRHKTRGNKKKPPNKHLKY